MLTKNVENEHEHLVNMVEKFPQKDELFSLRESSS